jgi:hypothetical protein
LLVGKRSNALKGFSSHVSSLLIMQNHSRGTNKIVKHPYAWPGHIEGVNSVLKMVHSNPDMCRF